MKLKLPITIAIAAILLFSCNKEDNLADRKMTDASGLQIDLEWNTGGSSTQSISDVDLELYLMKGTIEVDHSENSSSFESVTLSDLYSDATYKLEYEYFSGTKDVAYTIYITGIASGDTKTFTGTIYQSESVNFNLLDIDKDGQEYLFTEL